MTYRKSHFATGRYRLIFVKLQAKGKQLDDWAATRREALAQMETQMESLGAQRPATQMVMLTEEADFIAKFQFEMEQYVDRSHHFYIS